MSISIIGSNGNELSLITEDKLYNKFDDIELEYNLLKDKYLGTCNAIIINKLHYSHFLNQLMNLFKPGEIDIDKFITFLNIHNESKNLYDFIKETVNKFNMLYNLNDIIQHIKKKLFNKTDNKKEYDLYKEIKNILKKISIKFSKNQEIKNTIDNIENSLLELKKEILKIKMIEIKKKNFLEYNESNEKLYSKNFIENVMLNLDHVIMINKIVQKNIKGLDIIINKLTNELFTLHKFI